MAKSNNDEWTSCDSCGVTWHGSGGTFNADGAQVCSSCYGAWMRQQGDQ